MCDYSIISCNIKAGSPEHNILLEYFESQNEGCTHLTQLDYRGILTWCTTPHQVNLVFNPPINNNQLDNMLNNK